MRQSTTLLSALATCLACIGVAPVSAQQVGAPSGTGPYPAIAESRAELPNHNVPGSGRSRIQVDKSQLTRLHGPMLYLTGGPSDVAHPNAVDDVARMDRVPVFFGSLPVGHGGTFSAPDGGDWARVSARWLDWQLKTDADASWDFAGRDCRLCTDTRWTVVQKQLPPPTGPLRQYGP